MTAENVVINKIAYILAGRQILIDKQTAEKYSEIVCPITEHLLETLIHTFGDSSDAILSAKIQTDMENEIKEYGY